MRKITENLAICKNKEAHEDLTISPWLVIDKVSSFQSRPMVLVSTNSSTDKPVARVTQGVLQNKVNLEAHR